MSTALYRKYRPTNLDDVIGQTNITQPLKKAIKQGKISHAYLFTGPRGTGKTSVARIFAHAINKFDYKIEDDYLDIIEIDGASNRGIDDIRSLREKAVIAPSTGKYKVYIIDEVHMLTKEAFNALLKLLEEPPEHVVFVLATTDPQRIPATIISRTQMFRFQLADTGTMFKHLKAIAKAEKIKIDDAALKLIVQHGGGSFRDSISLLDQISTLSDSKITADDINQALGLPSAQVAQDLLAAYQAQDSTKIVKLIKQLVVEGIKPHILAADLINAIIAEPKVELLPLLKELPNVAEPFAEAKLLIAFLPRIEVAPLRVTSNAPATPAPARSQSKTAVPKAKPAAPKPTAQPKATTDFDWQKCLEEIRQENSGLAAMLRNTICQLKDGVAYLYPTNKIVTKQLNLPKNVKLLETIIGTKISIESPEKAPKDPLLSDISAIMGNIQEENNGNAPF